MTMNKILVLGAGYLGHRIANALPGAVLSKANVTVRDEVLAAIDARGVTHVINAAGKTGKPNVDWCEDHALETIHSNVVGAITVAEACASRGVHLTHLGSGCIFYGDSPHKDKAWREDDFANPVSVYSKSKYAADLAIGHLPNVCVARIRMPIDSSPNPRNLITKLAGYERVVDVENSVTIVDDLLEVLAALGEARAEGIFHVVNPGLMSHVTLLAFYQQIVDSNHVFTPIKEVELTMFGLAKAARSNCLLSSGRLAALGIKLPPIDASLEKAMLSYARAFKGARP